MSPGGKQAPSIWWWAFGYFAAYAPYAALTKVVTGGPIATVDGLVLLPSTVMATVVTAIAFLLVTGWWRHALKDVGGGRRLPLPTPWTALSGLCASGIIATTTLAYTFEGVSIVFVMLLMRGGLLILAPLIDRLTGRKIHWYSAIALLLSLGALTTSMLGGAGRDITLVCAIDVAAYLTFYFVRLQVMSRKAKSSDAGANLRYFVEEQLVSAPALLLLLAGTALLVPGEIGGALRVGFVDIWSTPVWGWGILIGVLSQGTGIFGSLILLDKSENTFAIPVNRASSVVAGVVGSAAIWLLLDARGPRSTDLLGASIMISAILVLSYGSIRERRRRMR
jgi:hypothetical protein